MTPVRLFAILALCSMILVRTAYAVETPATTAVRNLVADQRDAWNRGDLDAFMRGYWHSDTIRFAGGADFRYGWEATIARYRITYPDAATMGKLDFDLVEVRELAHDMVYLFGKWHLARPGEADAKAPHGLFTLIVERKDGTWVITRDHSSSADH